MFLGMPENVKIFCSGKLPSKYNISGRVLKQDVNYKLIDIAKEFGYDQNEQEELPF